MSSASPQVGCRHRPRARLRRPQRRRGLRALRAGCARAWASPAPTPRRRPTAPPSSTTRPASPSCKDRQLYLGGTLVQPQRRLHGRRPLPRRHASPRRATSASWSRPTPTTRSALSDRVAFGVGLHVPFGLETRLGEPGHLHAAATSRPARSSRASRSTPPSRSSSRTGCRWASASTCASRRSSLERRVPVVNPFTQQVVDGAAVHAGERHEHRLRVQPGRPGQAHRDADRGRSPTGTR